MSQFESPHGRNRDALFMCFIAFVVFDPVVTAFWDNIDQRSNSRQAPTLCWIIMLNCLAWNTATLAGRETELAQEKQSSPNSEHSIAVLCFSFFLLASID